MKGDLRVWNIINVPNTPDRYKVSTPKEGYDLITDMANEQLQMSSITSNAFGLEVFEECEWCEWYDENGDDIDRAEFD